MEHEFTETIRHILAAHFGSAADSLFANSDLIQYLNVKTISASQGSKARASFANLYAIYVLVEDYISHGFDDTGEYGDYEGARFSDLLKRQRELPFGAKLQNHALNHRLNQEFSRRFPQQELMPIIRDTQTSRYWFNERLLLVEMEHAGFNLSRSVIDIIDAYIEAKQGAIRSLIADLENLKHVSLNDSSQAFKYISELLRPNVDARIFEIVSYAILKSHFHESSIYWGWSLESIKRETLLLYKTGRTNANDGGIDFVMKPLGRFFQVTETTNVSKYFLDIDKVLHYPITFVVKSESTVDELEAAIKDRAKELYPVKAIVDKYMTSIEEIINIPQLATVLKHLSDTGRMASVVDEILLHSRIEFDFGTTNYLEQSVQS